MILYHGKPKLPITGELIGEVKTLRTAPNGCMQQANLVEGILR